MSGTKGLGTAVVTGASSGIGKVYAEKLAAQGSTLFSLPGGPSGFRYWLNN